MLRFGAPAKEVARVVEEDLHGPPPTDLEATGSGLGRRSSGA
jgi:hypothetical protein